MSGRAGEVAVTAFVTRYETKVHARNRNSDYGIPVTVYATSKQDAVNKAVAVGWSGHERDARVTVMRVVQEAIVLPSGSPTPPNPTATEEPR